MNTKKLTELALLIAVSLILFMVESLLPPLVPLAPYVKIGVSNVAVIFCLIAMGEKESLILILAKNLLGCLIMGNWYAFPFNICGSFFSLLTMMALYKFIFPKISIVSISVAGAIVSNIARTAVGAIIMQTSGLFLQLPIITVFSFAAGVFIGIVTYFIVKGLPEKLIYKN